jgi:hypothetical protein
MANPTSLELRFMVSSSSVEFLETVSTSDSVQSLKERLLTAHADKVTGATSADEIVLIFGGRFLANNEKISDIGGKAALEDKTTLHVMVRPKGEGGGGKGGGGGGGVGGGGAAGGNARGCCVVM